MKNIIGDLIGIIVVLASLTLLVIGLVSCGRAAWNNGYCACGGHWRYEQAVGHQYGTFYIYRCDKCGKRIEIGTYEEEIEVDETT